MMIVSYALLLASSLFGESNGDYRVENRIWPVVFSLIAMVLDGMLQDIELIFWIETLPTFI